jgi:integrase
LRPSCWTPCVGYALAPKRHAWLPVQSFHGLRHDFASLLARLGAPLPVATDMLGHSHELMTISYQHASDSDRREATDKVGAWLREIASTAQ